MKRWLKFPHGYNGRFGIVKEQGLQFKITITPIYLVSRLMAVTLNFTYIVQGAKLRLNDFDPCQLLLIQ